MKYKIVDIRFKGSIYVEYIITIYIGLKGLLVDGKQGYIQVDFYVPLKKRGEPFRCSVLILTTIDNRVLKIDHSYYWADQIEKQLNDEFIDSIDEEDFAFYKDSSYWREYKNRVNPN